MRKRFAFVAAMTVETVCRDATHDPSFPAGGDPVTTGSSFAIDVVQQHLSTRATRRMGPCVRRDDADVIAATATHHSPLTIRRPRAGGDPVTTGSRLCADVINQHERHGVWVPASAGTTPMVLLRRPLRYFSTAHAGAWSLAPSSDLMLRSTPALARRGAIAGLRRR